MCKGMGGCRYFSRFRMIPSPRGMESNILTIVIILKCSSTRFLQHWLLLKLKMRKRVSLDENIINHYANNKYCTQFGSNNQLGNIIFNTQLLFVCLSLQPYYQLALHFIVVKTGIKSNSLNVKIPKKKTKLTLYIISLTLQ